METPTMTIADWLIILAVLIGPILAVQVQKIIEAFKEKRDVRVKLFKELMATRAMILSPAHVQALNSIDMIFYGKSKKEKKVVDAWKIYLNHLEEVPRNRQESNYKINLESWSRKSNDLLVDLLWEMANSLGYEFDKVHLKKGAYAPQAHVDIDLEQQVIRKGFVDILIGQKSFPITLKKDDPPTEL